MNKLTMLEAKASGLSRYFTGKECPRGHIAERFVSTRACCLCARERKHAWLDANPDKANAQKRAYTKANAEQVKAWKSASQKRNRASANVRTRRWYETHREQALAATKSWAERNKERKKAQVKAWQLAHPERGAAAVARRRAAILRQMPRWADREAIAMIYRAAEVIRTTGFDVHVDHVVPLQGRSVAGLHVHTNLRILSAQENRKKSNQLAV